MAVGPASLARSAPTAAGRPLTLRGVLEREGAFSWLMLAPGVLFLLAFVAYPFFYAIYLSMLNKRETAFIGLDNYRFLMTRDTFWMIVRTSFLFTFLAVLWKAVLGFTLAIVIHTLPARGQRIWRGLSLIPWVMPLALSSLG